MCTGSHACVLKVRLDLDLVVRELREHVGRVVSGGERRHSGAAFSAAASSEVGGRPGWGGAPGGGGGGGFKGGLRDNATKHGVPMRGEGLLLSCSVLWLVFR
jgi:hypothetical protein